jgi:hypothetical protein
MKKEIRRHEDLRTHRKEILIIPFPGSYFRKKFEAEGIAAEYRNFDLQNIGEFQK